MRIILKTAPDALRSFLESMSAPAAGDMWGIITVKREYLRPITNDAFVLAVQRQVMDAEEVYMFCGDAQRVDIVWRGKQKQVFRQVCTLLEASIIRPELDMSAAAAVSYANLYSQKEEVLGGLRKNVGQQAQAAHDILFPDEAEPDEDFDKDEPLQSDLVATTAQKGSYEELREQKQFRPSLSFLVVEDQPFSQKLLCEILRGARLRNSKENPVIDAVPSAAEAWKVFLKRAPDIAFVDLCLTDGSGHRLAAAMKTLDPMVHVIVVTANNYEEELSIARQNNVDGFIVKPYNKKQILDCVEKYIQYFRSSTKGWSRGTGRSF